MMTDDEMLEQYGPKTDVEALVAARAVAEYRGRSQAREDLAALSDFERELIEGAYALGARDVLSRLDKALGSAAATADVAVLRRSIEVRGGLDTRLYPTSVGLPSYDVRAADLVSAAKRSVERRAASGDGS